MPLLSSAEVHELECFVHVRVKKNIIIHEAQCSCGGGVCCCCGAGLEALHHDASVGGEVGPWWGLCVGVYIGGPFKKDYIAYWGLYWGSL